MEQKDERQRMLESIFANVNTWLHFAEAKNAMIIALNIAMLGSIQEFEFCKDLKYLFMVLILASVIISLFSFLPILRKIEIKQKQYPEKNLLLFSDIASLSSSNEYLKELYKKYWGVENTDQIPDLQIERDFCFEIYENAKIAVRKYNYFKISLSLDILVCVLGVITFLIA